MNIKAIATLAGGFLFLLALILGNVFKKHVLGKALSLAFMGVGILVFTLAGMSWWSEIFKEDSLDYARAVITCAAAMLVSIAFYRAFALFSLPSWGKSIAMVLFFLAAIAFITYAILLSNAVLANGIEIPDTSSLPL